MRPCGFRKGEGGLNWEVFPEICDFALETINGSILSFAPSLQEKAYRKFLSSAALSEDDLLDELEDGYDFVVEGIDDFDLDEEDPLCGNLTLPEICKGLGIYAEDGKIVFHEFEYLEDEDQYISKEVLETLGWTVYEAVRTIRPLTSYDVYAVNPDYEKGYVPAVYYPHFGWIIGQASKTFEEAENVIEAINYDYNVSDKIIFHSNGKNSCGQTKWYVCAAVINKMDFFND